MSTPMWDIPEHCPIGVNKDGDGPVDEGDPEYVETVCWCTNPGCEEWRKWATS